MGFKKRLINVLTPAEFGGAEAAGGFLGHVQIDGFAVIQENSLHFEGAAGIPGDEGLRRGAGLRPWGSVRVAGGGCRDSRGRWRVDA